MPLSPYISFSGNCAEASVFYQHALGADILYSMTYGDMPKDDSSEEGCPSGMQFSLIRPSPTPTFASRAAIS